MGKTDPLLPCPHCGKEMRAGSLKRHESLCIRNPAAFARYREVLAATPGGKQGITCKRYAELSGTDKTLPIALTLHRQAGTSTWDALLAVFSLEPPPAEERRTVCGHCGKFVAATDLAEHTQACARRRRQCAAVPRPRPVRRGACARARAVPARRAATVAADGRRVFARAPGADRDAGGERGCCEVGNNCAATHDIALDNERTRNT